MRDRRVPAHLNLGARERASAAAALVLAWGMLRRRPAVVAAGAAAEVLLNRDLLGLLHRHLGLRGAAAGAGLHVLHQLTAVAAVPAGLAVATRRRRRRRYGASGSSQLSLLEVLLLGVDRPDVVAGAVEEVERAEHRRPHGVILVVVAVEPVAARPSRAPRSRRRGRGAWRRPARTRGRTPGRPGTRMATPSTTCSGSIRPICASSRLASSTRAWSGSDHRSRRPGSRSTPPRDTCTRDASSRGSRRRSSARARRGCRGREGRSSCPGTAPGRSRSSPTTRKVAVAQPPRGRRRPRRAGAGRVRGRARRAGCSRRPPRPPSPPQCREGRRPRPLARRFPSWTIRVTRWRRRTGTPCASTPAAIRSHIWPGPSRG